MMNFHTPAWMIREVAHGNTTIARTALRKRNLLFSTSARIKPNTVESTTTAMVHTRVFLRTSLKVDPLRTLAKLSNPQNPFIRPALLTSLIEVRKTSKIGKSMKIVIRRMLGSSHRYGSTAARGFFFFIFTPPNQLSKRIGSRSLMSGSRLSRISKSGISLRYQPEDHQAVSERRRQGVRSALLR